MEIPDIRATDVPHFCCIPSCWEAENSNRHAHGGQYLGPSTNVEDSGGLEEEEEQQAADTEEHKNNGEAHENGGSPKGSRGNGVEVVQTSFAQHFVMVLDEVAVPPQAEVTSATTGHSVPQPLRLHEHHYVDDGEADGENAPKDPNGLWISNVAGGVKVGSVRVFVGFGVQGAHCEFFFREEGRVTSDERVYDLRIYLQNWFKAAPFHDGPI